jgi:hypothetical protein
MRARHVSSPLLILVTLLALTGCLHGQPGSEQPHEPPRIEVRNRYFGSIVAYVVTGGNSVRLGLVQAGRTETFKFPVGVNPYGPGIRLLADPVGDFEGYLSDTIAVGGDRILLTVENQLRHSFVEIR